MFSFSLLFGFLLGAVAIVAAEGLALYWILRRLARRKRVEVAPAAEADLGCDPCVEQPSFTFPCEKQGFVWVLEQEFLKNLQHDPQVKGSKEQKNKKEYIEVSPVKKKAEIKDQCLILKDLDGFQTIIIQLLDCEIAAVSGSNYSSRKWTKRFPIKVENKKKIIYNGRKICYLYFETSWDKESWCKALRVASCSNMEKLNWYTHLSKEFHCYLTSLTSEHPLFLKASTVPIEATDKISKMEGNSSKVRYFFKKIAKKASKIGSEYKSSTAITSNKAERKDVDKNLHALHACGSTKSSSTEKSSLQDLSRTDSPPSTLLGSQQMPISCKEWDEKYGFDEGTFCLNLLISRLFFDAKRSTEINNLIKERIQRTLSNMRTPSFVGSLTCIGLDLGCHPPYLHSMRALPMDMKEAWALEVEIEYSGVFLLEIETRLEVCESEFQKGIVSTSMEPSPAGEATSDLLEGFRYYNQELNPSDDSDDEANRLDDEIKPDNGDPLRHSRNDGSSSSYMSRWRAILNSVADHVSQVPISLEASVASLRGTLRLQVKPPPSDQIWISFTSMPEIQFNFNSSIGEHKIASAHLALLIGNRFKAAIRESLVLPNCENIYIPWMLAEKDDWLTRSAAPFMWVRQESDDLTGKDSSKPQHLESKMKVNSYKGSKASPGHTLEHAIEEKTSSVSTHFSFEEHVSDVTPSEAGPTLLSAADHLSSNIEPEDSRAPLGSEDGNQGGVNCCRTEHLEPSQISIVYGKTSKIHEDTRTRKIGRRELIKDLGKKMSEKFDEKIRQTTRHVNENSVTDAGPETQDFADESTIKNALEDGGKGEDTTAKKMGKKELIKDFGKKMSEKFEVKMRQIEEIGRHAVENVSTDNGTRTSVLVDETSGRNSEEHLRVPLLTNDDRQESCDQDGMLSQVSQTSTVSSYEQSPKSTEEDAITKKPRRKERMWDLGKKMSEKFDEKRRHIEEKGRHIVEKMKENSKASEGSGSASSSKMSCQ